MDLTALHETWVEILSRETEKFLRPRATVQEEEWPDDYGIQLGITRKSIVETPLQQIPLTTYLLKGAAARHLMVITKAQQLLDLDEPRHVREITARHPELATGLSSAGEMWAWFEKSSGIFIETGANQPTQTRMVINLITNLIWKLKQQLRSGSMIVTDLENGKALEPYLDPYRLVHNYLLDINFVPGWCQKVASYIKKSVDKETGQAFARATSGDEFDPYNGSARCPLCIQQVIPGHLNDHLTVCEKNKSHRFACKCGAEFKAIQGLSQHQVLHCRQGNNPCAVCKKNRPCECQRLREKVCRYIHGRIVEASARESEERSIYDLRHNTKTTMTMNELRQFLADNEEENTTEGTISTSVALENTTTQREEYRAGKDVDSTPAKGTSTHAAGARKTNEQEGEGEDEDTLKCPFCNYQATTQTTLQAHIRAIHPTPLNIQPALRHVCGLCLQSFPTQRELQTHTTISHYQCGECDELFLSDEQRENHYTATHDTNSEFGGHLGREQSPGDWAYEPNDMVGASAMIHKCDWCDSTFASIVHKKLHTAKQHPYCATCQRNFLTLTEMRQHQASVHGVNRQAATPGNTQASGNPHTTQREIYTCVKCIPNTRYPTAILLLNHDQKRHGDPNTTTWPCVKCGEDPLQSRYEEHLRSHETIWYWTLGNARCRYCATVKLDSIAGAITHYIAMHREQVNALLQTIIGNSPRGHISREDMSRDVLAYLGVTDSVSCSFQGCNEKFPDNPTLERHEESKHSCPTCGWKARFPGELMTHISQHGIPKEMFVCPRCGKKLSSNLDLQDHLDGHKKHRCGKCGIRFLSQMTANKHEFSCTSITGEDVFAASVTTDPLTIALQCLTSMVKETDNQLLHDQLKKARSSLAQQTTARQHHQTQKTFTYLRLPIFGPGNVHTTYTTRDIAELTGLEFNGTGSPEENYTSMKALVDALERIIKARNITENVAAELLIQYLRAPAKDFAESFKEEYETKYGTDTIPAFEDIILYLEKNFINIRPSHAKEQLLAMKRTGGESNNDFFIRAWRCAHFASFSQETDRPSFKTTTVRDVLMRNLAPRNRQEVDKEELARKLRHELPFGPREIVEFLNNLKHERDARDHDKRRPDYSIVGLVSTGSMNKMTAPQGKVITPEGNRNRKRQGGWVPNKNNTKKVFLAQNPKTQQAMTNQPQTLPQAKQQAYPTKQWKGQQEDRQGWQGSKSGTYNGKQRGQANRQQGPPPRSADPGWVMEARRLANGGCFKCFRIGHFGGNCRTYTVLAKSNCNKCKKGYHLEAICKGRNKGPFTPGSANRIWINPKWGQSKVGNNDGQGTTNKTPVTPKGRQNAGEQPPRRAFFDSNTNKQTDRVIAENYARVLADS